MNGNTVRWEASDGQPLQPAREGTQEGLLWMILSTKTFRILSLKFCLTLNTTAVEHANLQFLTAMGPIRVFATSDHHSFFLVKCGESTLFSFFSIDPQHDIYSFLFILIPKS